MDAYLPKRYFDFYKLKILPENPDFVENVKEEDQYICVYCQEVLKPHILQLKCGHRLHETCYFKLLENDKSKKCPKQEDEECYQVDLDCHDAIWPDIPTERYFGKKLVHCLFKERGCLDTIPWSMLSNHCLKCPKRPEDFTTETDSNKEDGKICDDLKLVIEKEETNLLELKEETDELKNKIEKQEKDLQINKIKHAEQINEIDTKEKMLRSLKQLNAKE